MLYPATMYKAPAKEGDLWSQQTVKDADEEKTARAAGFISADERVVKGVPLVAGELSFPRTMTGFKVRKLGSVDIVELSYDGGSTLIKFKQGVCDIGGTEVFGSGTVQP